MQRWIRDHRRGIALAGGIVIVGLGTRLAYQSGALWLPVLGRKQGAGVLRRRRREVKMRNGLRKEAIIVLGGDTPLGRSMAMHFSSLGFIVLASVSSSAALSQFENHIPPSSRGYVKALVFDTMDPSGSLQPFIRALNAALSLRFPLTGAGDPYARPGENITIAGVINALGFAPPDDDDLISMTASTPTRSASSASSLSVASAPTSGGSPIAKIPPGQFSELSDKHIVSALCSVGALLPMLKALPNRSDSEDEVLPATVITLVSSPASRTSLPRQGAASVVAQAVAAGIQGMRRECEEETFAARTRSKTGLKRSSRQGLRQRELRLTVLEVNSGSLWGSSSAFPANEPTVTPSASSTTPRASISEDRERPLMGRSPSSSTVFWHHRSPSSAPVLNKASDLLLSTSTRLRPSYTVGTRSTTSYCLSLGHSLFSILPTSFIDIIVALRRQLSLRRAGMIGRVEHAFLPFSWGRGRNDPGQNQEPPRQPIAGPGPGPASNAHSRASLTMNQNLQQARAYELRDLDAQSLPESERSSGSGSGLPSSVPSSAYGDGENDGEGYGSGSGYETHSPIVNGQRSPYLSESSCLRGGNPNSANSMETSSGETSSSSFPSGSALSGNASGRGPWMGPPSRNSVSPAPASPMNSSIYGNQSEADSNARGTDSPLGASWVALGESQR
ncbi:hypothetical protein IE53DRAFT_177618 [Violaceomyces palustris]|uniref:Uncharacterized protein n=1 Tax=Violaceomyces palustris TaxID=1673888 RepID=A0ACD0NSJ9_9BASI|nr:hypothetical protein IE53DRAFT_177618 [Violaceomyces palustris]